MSLENMDSKKATKTVTIHLDIRDYRYLEILCDHFDFLITEYIKALILKDRIGNDSLLGIKPKIIAQRLLESFPHLKLSGKDLAKLLDVAPATLSEAASKGYECKGYNIEAWAVKNEKGRVKYYAVPLSILQNGINK